MTRRSGWARLLPAPGLSLVLCLSWLMLNESLSVGHGVLSLALGLLVPALTERTWPTRPRVKSWRVLLRLTWVVLHDIIKSNLDVARLVLGPEAAIQPRFIWVPLDLREPHALVLLCGIVTTTPGTVSAELKADHSALLVHALHCPDDRAQASIVADIKSRYEAPLKEIFE